MKDSLGDRIKDKYENRYRYYLPRRTYTIIRLDGKAFHTYTKGCERPFDKGLIDDMNATAEYLCQNIMGAKFAYVQSDEISLLLTDFEKHATEAWYDGNIQKITSISAALATGRFNQLRLQRQAREQNAEMFNGLVKQGETKLAFFDSRVYIIPDKNEVANYFVWRQQDCVRNSITMVAQSLYSHKELHGKSGDDKQEMIFQKGQNWNDFPVRQKRGGFIDKQTYTEILEMDMHSYSVQTMGGGIAGAIGKSAERSKWTTVDPPTFTQDPEFLQQRIPVIE